MVSPIATNSSASSRTVWGLDPIQLHTRFWAAHGVQVVRQGEPSQIVKHAELFLLTDPRSLVIFKLAPVMDVLNWIQPQVLFLRLHDIRERGYREKVVTDESDRFVRFQRLYESADRLARVVLTPEREIAQLWQSASDPLNGWRRLRRFTPRIDRVTEKVDGYVYDRTVDREVAHFLHDLIRDWRRPDSTIARATKTDSETWRDPAASIDPGAKLIGPVWVGAGRSVTAGSTVIGPAVVWDDPNARPGNEALQWLTIEPKTLPEEVNARPLPFASRTAKRLFDILFSFFALLFTVPFYPLVMFAIWLEDGGPFFFSHRRETIGGREFGCVKFRSMRKDAEKIQDELRALNQADGPQFHLARDPRLTRVGQFLRKTNFDELP